MTSWFLNFSSQFNDHNICRIKWSIPTLTAGCAEFLLDVKVKVSNLQLFRVHTNVMAPHYPHTQCHEETIHNTDHRVTTQRTKSTKHRIRERDLHISAPRRPWHNWVLPGGPGFPDADIPKLLLTNQRPVFCQVTNEEPGSVVWLWHIPPHSGLLHHLITSNYPHQVNNDVMLPWSGRGRNRQLGIFKFKRQKHNSM